jgi:uncharacterized protein
MIAATRASPRTRGEHRLVTTVSDSALQDCLLSTILRRWRVIENMGDFRALDPFFRIIEQGLAEFVGGDHFFDLLADDVVFDFIITVPNYPRHIVGRGNLIELYRGYGSTLFLDRCYDLRVHNSPSTSSVVLEYSSEGRVVATGQPYSNRYISVVVIKDRNFTAWRDYLDPLRVFAALEGRRFEPDVREVR